MSEVKLERKSVLTKPPPSIEFDHAFEYLTKPGNIREIKHYYYFRITIIITDLVSLIFGVYILLNFDDYLQVDFNYRNLLLFFIYIYSPSFIGILLLSFIFSVFIYLYFFCCEKERIYGAQLYDDLENDNNNYIKYYNNNDNNNDINNDINNDNNNDINNDNNNDNENDNIRMKSLSDLQLDFTDDFEKEKNNDDKNLSIMSGEREYIGFNADKVTLLPYIFTIFIILSIIYYFIALPSSIILLLKLWDDPYYGDKKEYWVLYTFIFANLINGVLILIVFLHMFFVKRIQNRILKNSMDLDENLIKNLRKEVREALKNAK